MGGSVSFEKLTLCRPPLPGGSARARGSVLQAEWWVCLAGRGLTQGSGHPCFFLPRRSRYQNCQAAQWSGVSFQSDKKTPWR